MIALREYAQKQVAVLGLGRSGLATAQALRTGGACPICWDDSKAARYKAAALGFSCADLANPAALSQAELLVVSPGIAHLYPRPAAAVAAALRMGIPLDNDIGLFFRALGQENGRITPPPCVVAITGTNGKSTTSALVHHILSAAGRRTHLGGNIGLSVLNLPPPSAGSVFVLELSSYQCELARVLTPDIAVLTNLTADHQERHGGIGGYFAAKRRLFAENTPGYAVIGVDEPAGQFLASQCLGGTTDNEVIRISAAQRLQGEGWHVSAPGGLLTESHHGQQVASVDLRPLAALLGSHNHQNACAAYAVCRVLGVPPEQIAQSMAEFPGLPHRGQTIAQAGGVLYVNDSKATNAEAARHALRTYRRVRWICGGQQKQESLAQLRAVASAAGAVVRAYVIGGDAVGFARQLRPLDCLVCTTMERAVSHALAEAKAGEVVLLAPAAASFDQYSSFEQRGAHFAALVKEGLQAMGGGAAP